MMTILGINHCFASYNNNQHGLENNQILLQSTQLVKSAEKHSHIGKSFRYQRVTGIT
jgi:hypothetical protein